MYIYVLVRRGGVHLEETVCMSKKLVGLKSCESVGGFFFFFVCLLWWGRELQVFLAGILILLVKYDPAGRNCLASPSLPLCPREHMVHCASFASPSNSQHAVMQVHNSACTPRLHVKMQPLSSTLQSLATLSHMGCYFLTLHISSSRGVAVTMCFGTFAYKRYDAIGINCCKKCPSLRCYYHLSFVTINFPMGINNVISILLYLSITTGYVSVV